MPKAKPVIIERHPDEPMPKRLLDKEIAKLARAALDLIGSGLSTNDLVALLHRRAPSVGKPAIHAVLQAVNDLGKQYAVKP